MDVTPEAIESALRETASSSSAPVIRIEIPHAGVDRKNSSPRSEAGFREAIRKALVVAKHLSSWPHQWNDANGGQRVTRAEIRFEVFNSRSWGTSSEAIVRYELSGRMALYDERTSGEIMDRSKHRDAGDARVVAIVKAIEIEPVPSWAQRVENGEVGSEPDHTPFGVCVCGHPHPGLACTEGECWDFVRDTSRPSPFVRGGFNDPEAQIRPKLEEAPRVQGVRDEDPSPEEVADRDAQMAIYERYMRGQHDICGSSSSSGRVRRDKNVKPTAAERAERFDARSRELEGTGGIPLSDVQRAQELHAAHLKRVEEYAERSKPGRPLKGKEPRMRISTRIEPAAVIELKRRGLSYSDAIELASSVCGVRIPGTNGLCCADEESHADGTLGHAYGEKPQREPQNLAS